VARAPGGPSEKGGTWSKGRASGKEAVPLLADPSSSNLNESLSRVLGILSKATTVCTWKWLFLLLQAMLKGVRKTKMSGAKLQLQMDMLRNLLV
jgi:hypothetical protein